MGIEWEPHTVKTEDGWNITIFRLTGRTGIYSKLYEQDEHKDKLPLYFAHGSSSDASHWLFSWPPYLMDAGYEVWLGNYRGGTFGNSNDNDDQMSLEERWDFSFAEMGKYDLPANVERVLQESGKDKVTLLGFSQGTASTFYGLATM